MLRHNWNISLQSISPTLSHMSNFKEARKWLLIAFCFDNPLSQIAILKDMTNMFCQSFMRCGHLVYHSLMPPQKLPCLIQWFVFTFLPQSFYKLKQLISTCITFNRCQSKFYDQSLQPLMWHDYTNSFITWVILWTIKFAALKTCKSRNLSFKISTTACTYIAPIILHSYSVSSQ
jgi:hypothetical protein